MSKNDHDQLIDEASAAIVENRRNIRMARTLALHANKDPWGYDRALLALQRALDELCAIAEQEKEEYSDDSAHI